MPDRVFVDTSFVLVLINERDQYHDQAQKLLLIEKSLLVTTVAVLLESETRWQAALEERPTLYSRFYVTQTELK